MVPNKSAALFAIVLMLGAATAATVSAQALYYSTASTAAPPGVNPVLYNLPNGLGSTFTQARATGGVVDATITLILHDDYDRPVANFSRYDMWLEKEVAAGTGNFVACTGGTVADANTNAEGITTWVAPLRAGGWSASRTLVVINGSPLYSNLGLLLRHNSADLNGDGSANLTDVPLFAGDFQGPYAFRSDLHFDGVVNLSDIPVLAAGLGATCP